jgi:hypothetical protein
MKQLPIIHNPEGVEFLKKTIVGAGHRHTLRLQRFYDPIRAKRGANYYQLAHWHIGILAY